MYPIDTAKLKIELSAFDKALNLSVVDGSSCFMTKISKKTALELAEDILAIAEEMPDSDNDAQQSMPFMAEEAVA